MAEPIITAKMQKEFIKTFKEVFTENILTLETYFNKYDFTHKKNGYFIKSFKDHYYFFNIDGKSGAYLGFELYVGVCYKKFDKLFGDILELAHKMRETNYRVINHAKSFENFQDIKPYFYCDGVEEFEKSTETIRFTFEKIALDFYHKNDTLIKIRDYIMSVDISDQTYGFYYFQMPDTHAIGIVAFITYLLDYKNFDNVLIHYEKMFKDRITYKLFEDFYLPKILKVDRKLTLKKLNIS